MVSTPGNARVANSQINETSSHGQSIIIKDEESDHEPTTVAPQIISGFAATVSSLYSLTTQSITVSLDGDVIDPSLWHFFIVPGEAYCLRFVPTVTLKVVVTEELSLMRKGANGKMMRGWTVDSWALDKNIWETKYVLAKRLAEGGCNIGAEGLALVWWVEGGGRAAVSSKTIAERQKVADWKSANGLGGTVAPVAKGKEKEKDDDVMKIRGLEGKTTIEEVLDTLGCGVGACEKLTVELGRK
ncbi:hypothetical protein EJ05DRAFT_488400 [Pseudovirgaria hyperparasitica]|uniref:Uncharacterized protein n=1 Tax=Pseudovirgaria hyperparasitica TaxID=470096 RepID=A0A6A6VYG2_9PEZI|nr:uncharacterized protein EJ05DRAFT_488400 [Pseudovirgaria hyperparasitica]KAF2755672.1 hypothetical protein EJ05DRAFT_488400 [Pseudovirgaria hyperparasitica]